MKIDVLVVDDHELIGMALRKLFSKYADIRFAGFARSGKEAFKKVNTLKPDVILMDILLPDKDGFELSKTILKEKPTSKIILHTSVEAPESILRGFALGAMGYVPKSYNPKEVIEAIYTVQKGEHYSKGYVSDVLINDYLQGKNKGSNGGALTNREVEVLQALARGHTNQKIADSLVISVRTVEAHKANIMKKLKLFSTAELVIYAIKNKIVVI
ncbi:MAG: response regulator transcription factor [Bacteroidales bacterium]